jgi:penicillin-binding protein 1A
MRSAHQGVPVAYLPNAPAQGGGISTLTQIASQITGPTPPVPVQAGAGRPVPSRGPVRPEPSAGLDGWLMDRLFGGRR